VVNLRRQVMRVLLLHQVGVLVLELVNDKDALGPVAELDKCLEDTAAIMLVAEGLVLITDVVDALLDDCVLLLTAHFLLLHQQLVVRDLNREEMVRPMGGGNLLLAS